MSRRDFEEWEKTFIYLTNPIFSHKEIAKYLNRSKGSIQVHCYRRKLLKKDYFLEIKNEDRFGSLVVKSKSCIRKRHQYYWCQCDCGNLVSIRSGSLGENNSTTCGKCFDGNQRQLGNISRLWFTRIKKAAQNRKLEFKLTMQMLDDLLSYQKKQCVYTKLPIFISNNYDGLGSTASLDRIDSTKGYIIDNVQFVHKDINWMKKDFDEKHFIKLCKLVSNNN